MRIRLIYNHITHHARLSGYDMMARYTLGDAYETGPVYRFAKKYVTWKRLEKYRVYHTPWYGGDKMRRELEVIVRNFLPRKTLTHFYYAENDLRMASTCRFRWNNKVVGSFHQPPEFLDKHVEDKTYIRRADAVVVVARSQVDYMAQFLPRDRIFVVPHGIHVQYWSPDPSVPRDDPPSFVFVGWWLRDLDLTKAAIHRCAEVGLPARFKIVTAQENHEHLRDLPNTDLLSGIDDDQLLDAYRRATGLFLPLKMSTANNAILESMACGTPVISTRTGGIPEYVDPSAGILVEPGDVDGAVDAIRRLCEDRELVARLGAGGRRRAESLYAWEVVGELMNDGYRRILGIRQPEKNVSAV
ncbi:MAG: glycosyltransferase [Planctomycetes bacterium]|nr:glycosyltransferase [Planctomycetota bacterium]